MKESYSNPEHERAPDLPEDPNEAAEFIKELWERGGGWESQHPLRNKPYEELTETEREQLNASNTEYLWLAEMYLSESMWSESVVTTNHGKITAFRFGYDIPKEEENVPDVYIYQPLDESKPALLLSKRKDEWEIRPLRDVMEKYSKYHLDY